jgi:hypothetical protein
MLTALGAAVACGSSGHRARWPATRRTSCHGCGAGAAATSCPHGWLVGGRRPDTCPGGSPPRTPAWPSTPAWPRVPDTSRPDGCRPDGSHSGSSGRSVRCVGGQLGGQGSRGPCDGCWVLAAPPAVLACPAGWTGRCQRWPARPAARVTAPSRVARSRSVVQSLTK